MKSQGQPSFQGFLESFSEQSDAVMLLLMMMVMVVEG